MVYETMQKSFVKHLMEKSPETKSIRTALSQQYHFVRDLVDVLKVNHCFYVKFNLLYW